MVGLHYLKHFYDLFGEAMVERRVEKSFWQLFCGFDVFNAISPSPSLKTLAAMSAIIFSTEP